MMGTLSHSALRLASHILPASVQQAVVTRVAKPLHDQLFDEITDDFQQILLRAMSLAFAISEDYRRNIEGFEGTLVFRTRDGGVGATAVFHDGRMKVEDKAREVYDCRVQFKDAHALWSTLLAENQDVLDSILNNTVDADGNLNCLYRFGYLARDLTRRLEIS